MTLSTARAFTKRNWTCDRLKIAAAHKGQKISGQKELAGIVRNQLELYAAQKRRAAQ